MKYVYRVAIVFLLLCTIIPHVYAQTPTDANVQEVEGAATLGVADMINVKDTNVQNGSILSSSQGGAVLSTVPYDSQVIGVVSRDAGIVLSSNDATNTLPVISSGTVYVLVSSQKGMIKKNDLVTSSTIPGIGVKATDSGYVLGYALEDYSNPNPKQTGKIAVSLNMHYFNSKTQFGGTLTDIFKIALLPTKDSPAPIFKYIVAALVVFGSLILGFLSFGRTAAKGVEALGRNPAASRIIQLGIIFNVIIVIVIIAAGLAVSFLILRL